MTPHVEALEARNLLSTTVIMPPFGPGATVQAAHGYYGPESLAAGAGGPVDFRQPGYVSLADKYVAPGADAALSPENRAVIHEQWFVPNVVEMNAQDRAMIGPDTVVYGFPMEATKQIQAALSGVGPVSAAVAPIPAAAPVFTPVLPDLLDMAFTTPGVERGEPWQ